MHNYCIIIEIIVIFAEIIVKVMVNKIENLSLSDDKYLSYVVMRGMAKSEQTNNTREVVGYIIRGSKQIECNRYINAGSIYYISANNVRVCNIVDEYSDTYEELSISFNIKELREFITEYVNIKGICKGRDDVVTLSSDNYMCEGANDVIARTAERIKYYIDYKTDKEIIRKNINRFIALDLLLTILENSSSCISEKVINILDRGNDTLRKVVSDNITSGITINKMARLSNMSISNFKRAFREIYGTTPHKWIIEKRLAMSATLMTGTNLTLSEIASECGFSNSSHLIKRFKKRYNMTPKEYKRLYNCDFYKKESK